MTGQRPPRPCTAPSCPALVTGKSARCPRHRRERNRAYDAQRGTKRERGYGPGWQKVRLAALAREPLCRFCLLGAPGEDLTRFVSRMTVGTVVDHIVELARGGTHEASNLRVLCKRHHDRRTAIDSCGWGTPARKGRHR